LTNLVVNKIASAFSKNVSGLFFAKNIEDFQLNELYFSVYGKQKFPKKLKLSFFYKSVLIKRFSQNHRIIGWKISLRSASPTIHPNTTIPTKPYPKMPHLLIF